MRQQPSQMLVLQRIRNRILEYMESVAEFELSRGAWDLDELVNTWEMNVSDPFNPTDFPSPAFTADEVAAMAAVHESWLAFANATPPSIKDEKAAFRLPEWKALVGACTRAGLIFHVRGRLPGNAQVE